MNSDFQETIKSLTFKTYFRNQVETFGYDDLFANRRVIVLSITNVMHSLAYLKKMNAAYQDFINLGIDDVYCVNSETPLIGPWADKHSNDIRALPDRNSEFVSAVAKYYNNDKPLSDLSKFWQYIIVINNGNPEKFWQNPFKVGMPWKIIKSNKYWYHDLSIKEVKQYLVDTQLAK